MTQSYRPEKALARKRVGHQFAGRVDIADQRVDGLHAFPKDALGEIHHAVRCHHEHDCAKRRPILRLKMESESAPSRVATA